MRKLQIAGLFLAFFFLFFSCTKDEFHLGRLNLDEVTLWTYTLPEDQGNYDEYLVPAVDEYDNIYVIGKTDMPNNSGEIISLTAGGTKRWSFQTFGYPNGHVVYSGGKVYVLSYYETFDAIFQTLSCLDASDGSLVWSDRHINKYGTVAMGDNALYWAAEDTLYKYSLDGQIMASLKITYASNIVPRYMSVYGNHIYLMAEDRNDTYAQFFKLTDNGNAFTLNWVKSGFDDDEKNSVCDLAIDNNGNVYVMTTGGLYCISLDGSTLWKNSTIHGLNSFERHSVTITDSGKVLTATDRLIKLNSSGVKIYERETYDFINYDFQRAPVIGENNFYYTVDYEGSGSPANGIRAINPDGTGYWYTREPIGRENATLLHNGNLVFISDGIVYCVKTQSGGLSAKAQWPKLYYDYGNTSYKSM